MIKLNKILLVIIFALLVSVTSSNAQTGAETAYPTNSPASLREKIRVDIDAKMQNVKTNQVERNQIIEKNRPSSTTPRNNLYSNTERPVGQKNMDQVKQKIANPLSSSSLQYRGNIPAERKMAGKILIEKREMIVKQLNVAIKNLEELSKRIVSRIEKDRMNNKDMSTVIESLKIANEKITLAGAAVAKLRAYEPITKDTASTTPVNLDQIRALLENTHKTIREAHRALTDVVVAIARISGINKERNSTSTPARNSTPVTSPMSTTVPSPVTSIPPSTN